MAAINIIETKWRWNGTLSTRAHTDYIALHHAEASTCTAEQVDRWHKENGWSGIGYHFFVRKDGSIYRGRPLTTMGAHVSGMNNCSIGICAEGKYSTETMPDVQKRAICRLLVYLKDTYYPNAKIVGHKEIGDSDCPGRNYPLEDIKQNYRAYAGEEVDEVSKEEFNKLVERVNELGTAVNSLEGKVGKQHEVYNYIDKNMPEWARDDVQWAKERNIIVGDDKGELGLSPIKLWVVVVVARTARYIGKLIGVKMS